MALTEKSLSTLPSVYSWMLNMPLSQCAGSLILYTRIWKQCYARIVFSAFRHSRRNKKYFLKKRDHTIFWNGEYFSEIAFVNIRNDFISEISIVFYRIFKHISTAFKLLMLLFHKILFLYVIIGEYDLCLTIFRSPFSPGRIHFTIAHNETNISGRPAKI